MFTGTLTASAKDAVTAFQGTIHAPRFDIAINLTAIDKMSERSPDYAITAQNKAGRTVRIGSGWSQKSKASGNTFVSMQMDVGIGAFRVNAVQTTVDGKKKVGTFDIIPFTTDAQMKSASISGELIKMDADEAFSGHVANMMFDMEFIVVPNAYKSEDTHPDYHIEQSSPAGVAIRTGAGWMAKSKASGNPYITLLINTPDGQLRVNAVQNEAQRGSNTFSIIPFADAEDARPFGDIGLAAVA